MNPRSPLARWRDESWRVRAALGAVLGAATVLLCWNLARGGDFSFYEASARSMSESWWALLTGAFDPAATVTLDKLSGFAVPQALSLRLFGTSTAALALPQVIEGIVTIWCVGLIGLRWGGRRAGLLAAGAAASTPIFVSMFAHPMEDSLVTMALALAFVLWQRAVVTEAWWPLLLAALFVGVGFQAKMMQAWFIVPALAIGLLLAGSGARRRALGRAAVFTTVSVVTSLAWITAVQLLPAASRPFVDGSTDDDVFAMVFGYNGIDRLLPGAVAGAVGSSGAHHAVGIGALLATTASSDPGASHAKLLLPAYATQVGWLYPVALLGIVLALVRWWPRRSATARRRARFAVVGALAIWLVTAAGVLSLAHVPHTAYVAALGVQLAALAAIGVYEGVRMLRSSRPLRRFALPAALAVQAAWSIWLGVVGAEPAVLAIPAAVVSIGGLIVCAATAARRATPTYRIAALAAAVAVLAGPVCFSLQALDAARDGSGGDASVGVVSGHRSGQPAPFALSAPAMWGGSSTLPTDETQLLAQIGADPGTSATAPLFLTDSWALAAPVIDATGDEVLTDGGYSGHVEVFDRARVASLVAQGDVRFLVVSAGASSSDPVAQVAHGGGCSEVRAWGSDAGSVSASGSTALGSTTLGRHTQDSGHDARADASDGAGGAQDATAERFARAHEGSSGSAHAEGFSLWQCAGA